MSRFPVIGILGGGQLGRMSALAAIRMGIHVRTLSPSPSGPVGPLGDAVVGDWNDPDVMEAFVRTCDVITVESEWAPAELAESVAPDNVAVWPSGSTLRFIRHKGTQKSVLAAGGIPVPSFRPCATIEEARDAIGEFGYPVLAKRYEGSYDGYGNATIRSEDDLTAAWTELAANDGLLIEQFVDFVRELAVMVARSASGETVVYPVVDTEQQDHRCHAVTVPAQISDRVANAAHTMAIACADAVSVVGLLGVELFELPDGSVLVNELAPRPHNTGHYTIEACHTSQFENHIRAVLDWPLGNPDLQVPAAVMINVLGHRAGTVTTDGMDQALRVPGAAVHIYGKQESRPKRKMGHVTVTASSTTEARERAERAASHIRI